MSRSIKISELTYNDLQTLQRPRETFNDVVRRLLTAYLILAKAVPLLDEKRKELQERVNEIHSGEKTDG